MTKRELHDLNVRARKYKYLLGWKGGKLLTEQLVILTPLVNLTHLVIVYVLSLASQLRSVLLLSLSLSLSCPAQCCLITSPSLYGCPLESASSSWSPTSELESLHYTSPQFGLKYSL
jgi:hypothetical protein